MSQTALITGASAGLGRDFADLFAADGHNVVLVARRRERLEEIATSLEGEYGIYARVEDADLSDPEARDALLGRLADDDVHIDYLVNNAGFGSNGAFWQMPVDGELGQVRVNIEALVHLTHALLPAMVEKGSGRILNIASIAGFQAGPYMSVYYATKAFVISFTEGIAHELKGTGVSATAHCPGPTATEFGDVSGNGKTLLFQKGPVATSREVAEHAYRAMKRRELISIHGALNSIGAVSTRFTPRSVLRAIAAKINTPA